MLHLQHQESYLYQENVQMTQSPQDARIIQLPPGYDPQIAPWVWAVEDTRQRTKHTLTNISATALDWGAPPDRTTISTILYHLVAIEMSYLYEDILEQGWASELDVLLPYDVRTDQGHLTLVHGENLLTHLQRLDQSRALLLNALRQMTVEEWRRPRRIEDYLITPEWALHHLMQHEAEHRSQISELRRRAEHGQHP
jgi:hypothetical protein